MNNFEKTPMQSKKFIGYMVASILMKFYLFFATWKGENTTVVITAIMMTIFLDVGYILGQSFVDALIRYATIVTGKVEDVVDTIVEKTK